MHRSKAAGVPRQSLSLTLMSCQSFKPRFKLHEYHVFVPSLSSFSVRLLFVSTLEIHTFDESCRRVISAGTAQRNDFGLSLPFSSTDQTSEFYIASLLLRTSLDLIHHDFSMVRHTFQATK